MNIKKYYYIENEFKKQIQSANWREIKKLTSLYSSMPWGMLIIDELNNIKNVRFLHWVLRKYQNEIMSTLLTISHQSDLVTKKEVLNKKFKKIGETWGLHCYQNKNPKEWRQWIEVLKNMKDKGFKKVFNAFLEGFFQGWMNADWEVAKHNEHNIDAWVNDPHDRIESWCKFFKGSYLNFNIQEEVNTIDTRWSFKNGVGPGILKEKEYLKKTLMVAKKEHKIWDNIKAIINPSNGDHNADLWIRWMIQNHNNSFWIPENLKMNCGEIYWNKTRTFDSILHVIKCHPLVGIMIQSWIKESLPQSLDECLRRNLEKQFITMISHEEFKSPKLERLNNAVKSIQGLSVHWNQIPQEKKEIMEKKNRLKIKEMQQWILEDIEKIEGFKKNHKIKGDVGLKNIDQLIAGLTKIKEEIKEREKNNGWKIEGFKLVTLEQYNKLLNDKKSISSFLGEKHIEMNLGEFLMGLIMESSVKMKSSSPFKEWVELLIRKIHSKDPKKWESKLKLLNKTNVWKTWIEKPEIISIFEKIHFEDLLNQSQERIEKTELNGKLLRL